MKRSTEKILRKMAGDGYPEVGEALAEIERLRKCIIWHRNYLWGKHSIGHPIDLMFYKEALGDD